MTDEQLRQKAEEFWQDDLAKFTPHWKECPGAYKVMFIAGWKECINWYNLKALKTKINVTRNKKNG